MSAYFLNPGLTRLQGTQLSPDGWAHSQLIAVDPAAIAFTGDDISISAASADLTIEASAITFAGQDISLDLTGGTVITIEPAPVALAGADVQLNLLSNLSIDPRPLTFSGGDISISLIDLLPNNPVGGGSRSTIR